MADMLRISTIRAHHFQTHPPMTPGTCIHYRGTQTLCAAGIDVRAHVGGAAFGWGCRIPCIKRQFHPGRPAEKVPCDKYQEPSAQELEEFKAEIALTTLNINRARAAIVAQTAGMGAPWRGVMRCPVCTAGELIYSLCRTNGHIHAACSTPECVRWIE